MDYNKKFDDLQKYAKMASEEDVKLFDRTVYELAETQDPEVLRKLIDIFDDECEFPEVMYSLVHAIETYPEDIYVFGILSKVADFRNYPEWFETLIYGILNSPKCLETFKQNLHLAKKEALLELLDKIYAESVAHRPVVNELRDLLTKENKR